MAELASQARAEGTVLAARRIGSVPVRTLALFAALLVPNLARAQCNQTTVHPVPPAQVSTSFANQTFDAATPYQTVSTAQNGCDGGPGGAGQSGGNGFPGQPGGPVSNTATNVTINGPTFTDPGFTTYGGIISSVAGSGGNGGTSGSVDNALAQGGDGVPGGAGGQVTVQFTGTITGTPSLAAIGLAVSALGGTGGFGGDTSGDGIYFKLGGNGADGGTGGSVTLTGNGGIQALDYGLRVLVQGGGAGHGGAGLNNFFQPEAQGGNGGNGGTGGSINAQWLTGSISSGLVGVFLNAGGGEGGAGGDANSTSGVTGGNGGAGGNGSNASFTLGSGAAVSVSTTLGNFVSPVGGSVEVLANGGNGGSSGIPGTAIGAAGGNGGNGGNGGSASATILGAVHYQAAQPAGASSVPAWQGVLVQANGGAGGNGGNINSFEGGAGSGGFAGNGGSATLVLGSTTSQGSISTNGNFAHGALAQSVGGSGGNGGNTSFGGFAGSGQGGGNGGPAEVDAPNGKVVVDGPELIALLAQSIGGGGGSGGDADNIAIGAELAIGGNGGQGGSGNTVTLNLGPSIFASTNTLGGGGIVAQSIGGSGGAAGSASSKGIGVIGMAIGGDAQAGAPSGAVTITSSALITTYGDHAVGVEAQSIGGGGGDGGSAFSFTAGIVPLASVSVGGRGGGGGPAGNVSITNQGQITTYGADAPGLLAQSIGGGGGNGGAAAARGVAISPSKYIPAISVNVALGGGGGAGNTAGTVTFDNAGLVTTAGDGAPGVIAQSIGGGGGTAGDATASSFSQGTQANVNISVAVAVGGRGGSGGTGNTVTVTNEGLIATLGQDAYGVFAQSIGGGGGDGGAGDATAAANEAKFSFSAAIAVGGNGASGGTAGPVNLTNSGSITTRGDGADAVFAQSVGGGGGAAGGGIGTAAGGNLAVTVGVGGSGGTGGDGSTVTVTNSGGIVTRGTDAAGILVQSIGGGGGKAGKGGATAGGVSTLSNAQALFDIMGQGLGLNQKVQNLGDGILQVGQIGEDIQASYTEVQGLFSQPQSDPNAEEGTAMQMNVAVSVGGIGGAAGQGGQVNATNSGAITTYGAQSYGIFAQSVGGGGGDGGAASSTGSASDDLAVQSSVAVGGKAGGGGSGGPVSVTNDGSIETQGVAAFGIYAQSVGGGGGNGALAGVVSGSLKSLSVSVGSNGGGAGDGGDVIVKSGTDTPQASITTLGKHSVGILAQSIGGGGGTVTTMTTDETFDPSKIVNNPQGRVADIHGLSLNFGGQNGSSGNGGSVQVYSIGNLTTSGLDSHGILAQSIGGGGGFVVGGQINGVASNIPAGGAGGNGGEVLVVASQGNLTTAGDGAYGIIAQSMGGGGGFAGDPSAPKSYDYISDQVTPNSGNGGSVTVVVGGGATVRTSGSYAPAIFAQSIGGGGGVVGFHLTDTLSPSPWLERGSADGGGSGGSVLVEVRNSHVLATGIGSAGIVAQSDGDAGGQISIVVGAGSSVVGGTTDTTVPSDLRWSTDAAAVRLLGGNNNIITNQGTISDAGPIRNSGEPKREGCPKQRLRRQHHS